jgi:glyoxalase family protein
LAVPRSALDFWARRIAAAGQTVQRRERFGEPVLCFADPHGLPLELVGLDQPSTAAVWDGGPVDRPVAIRGFHSATATLNAAGRYEALLQDTMGLRLHGREGRRYRFMTADATSPGHFFDLVIDPQAPVGRPGGGTVHHIAFRTASDRTQAAWQTRLRQSGLSVSEVRDRKYFRSIYFQSPGGLLFEIATDPPGFGVDETPATLGCTLKLPPQYEPLRRAIEQRLPPLRPAKRAAAMATG